MSKVEIDRYSLILNVLDGRLSISEFSVLIQKSYRQSQRIIKRASLLGAYGVKRKESISLPHNKTSHLLKEQVVDLLRTKYRHYNLTHFRESLYENEGIKIGKNILYRWAKEYALIKYPKRRKGPKLLHMRPRMSQEGMMIQLDGSLHVWYGKLTSTLIAGIDDATSKILWAEFFDSENSVNCLSVMRSITEKYGIANCYYVDQAGHFGKINEEQTSTQVGRALSELGVKLILATRPESKGRVERLFRTLQDRLIAELNRNCILTKEEANNFLKTLFIPRFNTRFGHEPRVKASSFCEPPSSSKLDKIFCLKFERTVTKTNLISFDAKRYMIQGHQSFANRSVTVRVSINGKIDFSIGDEELDVILYEKTRSHNHYSSLPLHMQLSN